MSLNKKITDLKTNALINKDIINKKQVSDNLIEHQFYVKTISHESTQVNRLKFDWVWTQNGYYQWQLIFDNFQINNIPNFEWKVILKTDVEIEDLRIQSNGFFVLEYKTFNVQKVIYNMQVFSSTDIKVKPVIVYHGHPKKFTNQNVNYTFSSSGGPMGG